MREELRPLVGKRARFRASLGDKGKAKGLEGKRLLFDVSLLGESSVLVGYVADHVWIKERGSGIARAGITEGERIEFTALVVEYKRADGTKDVSFVELKDLKRAAFGHYPRRNH